MYFFPEMVIHILQFICSFKENTIAEINVGKEQTDVLILEIAMKLTVIQAVVYKNNDKYVH